MIDPFVAMMVWPQSTDTGDETDWEAVRAEEEVVRPATPEDWEEFWNDFGGEE
jgi:hypothetical protein